MTSQDVKREGFVINNNVCTSISETLHTTPDPKKSIVSGRLDRIEHSRGQFILVMKDGTILPCVLDSLSSNPDVEVLDPLWGKQSTVEGTVRFRPNGDPRFIEAVRIREYDKSDALFETIPTEQPRDLKKLVAQFRRKGHFVDFDEIIGSWPGDETIEELMTELG